MEAKFTLQVRTIFDIPILDNTTCIIIDIIDIQKIIKDLKKICHLYSILIFVVPLNFAAPMHDVSIDVSNTDAENIGVNCSTRTDRDAPYVLRILMNDKDYPLPLDGTVFGSHSDCSVDLFWFGTVPIPANFTLNSTNPIFKCKIENELHKSTREATQEFIIPRGVDLTTEPLG